jgi:hypothetical protein
VAGDQSGTVTSFQSYGSGGEHDWKFRVVDDISVKALEVTMLWPVSYIQSTMQL